VIAGVSVALLDLYRQQSKDGAKYRLGFELQELKGKLGEKILGAFIQTLKNDELTLFESPVTKLQMPFKE
jgi:hypothetical protein